MNSDILILLTGLCIAGIILVIGSELKHRKFMGLEERLDEEGLASYWNARLMKEGVKPCADCGEAFRPDERNPSFCNICAPGWAADAATPRQNMTYGEQPAFHGTSKAFRPVSMMWPDLFKGEKDE